jgi:MerR family transcriptional regulator, copper efflux regulator
VGTYRISQLAGGMGMPATTLRFYEKVGLLPSQRTAAGYRVYDDAAAERLRFIAPASTWAFRSNRSGTYSASGIRCMP